jgi:hypothetical protein
LPTRLSKIDELTRPDHTFLEAGDDCYYLGEYTARAGYTFSATNDVIQNLKKPMDRKGGPEWKWKSWAIDQAAKMLREVLPETWLDQVTFVDSIAKTLPRRSDKVSCADHRVKSLQVATLSR